MAAPQGETFVRVAEAARILGVSRQTVYRYHANDLLPGSMLVPGSGQHRKMLLIPRASVERLAARS